MRVEAQRRGAQTEGGMPGWLPPAIIGAIIGLVLGLIYAWMINPVEYTNASPGDLAPTGKKMWVEMTADYYARTGDDEEVQRRLAVIDSQELATILGELESEAGGQMEVQRLRAVADVMAVTPGTPPAEPAVEEVAGGGSSLGNILFYCGVAALALVVLGGIAVVVTRMRQGSTTVRARPRVASRNRASVGTPIASAFRTEVDEGADGDKEPVTVMPREESAEEVDTGVEEDLDRLFDETADEVGGEEEAVREIDFAEPEEAAPVQYSPALDEFVTRYNYGDDGYDMSFSIETPQTEFLGECGVGISDIINEGTPQQATAFEVWLFDKDDIRTVTKVLLSEHAWNNDELRSRLAPKGELILAREGDTLDLETKSLRVRARVREVDYGENGPAPSAYFERLVVELTPQQKS